MVTAIEITDDGARVVDDPDEMGSDEYATWVYENVDAVTDVLEELTSVYNEAGEQLPIEDAEISHVSPHSDTVGIELNAPARFDTEIDGANIFRILSNLTAHEVAHVNWSDLSAKERFSNSYPGWMKLPGHLINILEDQYVDAERCRRWHGMKQKEAYYTWLQMEDSTPVDELYDEAGRTTAIMSAIHQHANAGYVKGIDDAPDEVSECLARIEPLIDRVRVTHDRTQRQGIAHAAMAIISEYIDSPDIDEEAMDEQSSDTVGLGEPEAAPDAEDPTVDPDELPDEVVEDILEAMEESDELPDPIPEDDDDEEVDTDADIDVDMDELDIGDTTDDLDIGDGDATPEESDVETRDMESIVSEYGADNLRVQR